MRTIYGPTTDEGTQRYQIRKKKELEEQYKQPDIMREAGAQRLRRAGYIQRQPAGLHWYGKPNPKAEDHLDDQVPYGETTSKNTLISWA